MLLVLASAALVACEGNKPQSTTGGATPSTRASGTNTKAAPAEEAAKPAGGEMKTAESPSGAQLPILSTMTTPGGVVVDELKLGDGKEAGPRSVVKIHYHGMLQNGNVFDTTRGDSPAEFPLVRLIKGWQEGIPGMKVGGIRRLTVPAALGYGAGGTPDGTIPPNATLVFAIELLDVK
jgi:FKBP-type peptidyl-prolyl cis-trans isomerase